MIDNDKYTIKPFTDVINFGGLTAGQAIMFLPDGSYEELNGPYCQWPKTEPRTFVVVDPVSNKKALDLFNKTKSGKMFKIMHRKPKDWLQRVK